MPELYGTHYSPVELHQLVSTMDQLAGLRSFEYSDGKARGLRAIEVWTGSGLRFTIYVDRGLDIGPAEFAGKPLAWLHPALGTPAQYEPNGYGWLRTFGGGLVTTCGLTHFGQPEEEGGTTYGLHGRISHLPAQNVSLHAGWQADDYVLEITGEVRQAVLFGENLLLKRRISTRLGARCLAIQDTIVNEGYRQMPLMLLYHCNFGFPVVSPGSQVEIVDEQLRPRDAITAAGIAEFDRFGPPVAGYREQVFFHTPRVDAEGWARAAIINPALNLSVYIRYRAVELPALTQWKMTSPGEYICALEPCTHHEGQRAVLRRESRLRELAPSEEMQTSLEIGVY